MKGRRGGGGGCYKDEKFRISLSQDSPAVVHTRVKMNHTKML